MTNSSNEPTSHDATLDATPRPTLTVVIPAFDEGANLDTCLDALEAQTEPPDEIIVVDNNSRDDTGRRAEAFAARRSVSVRVLSEPRKGTVHARTTGYDAVTTDLIGRIDVDTLVPPDWSARVRDFFAAHGAVYGAGAGFCTAYDLPFQQKFADAHATMSADLDQRLAEGDAIDQERLFGSNMAITRRTWRSVRSALADSTARFEDLDLGLTLGEHGHRIAVIPGLTATISGRRYLDPLPTYLRYARREMTTYRAHGMKREERLARVRLAVVTLPFYLVMWVPFRAYDPDTRTFSLGRLQAGRRARRVAPAWT